MDTEALDGIGLTKSEIAVYIALLEIGSSTTGPIIRASGIASGKAYLILDKLMQKGLVTRFRKGSVKQYQAKDPLRLLDYVHQLKSELLEKEKRIKKIIPQLQASYESKNYETTAELFEGRRAFKTFHEFMLDVTPAGETICVMSVPAAASELFSSYYEDWNKRRVAKKVHLKILYDSGNEEVAKRRSSFPLTEVRVMKNNFQTPAWNDVFLDYVATLNVEDEPHVFLVRNKTSAQSYMIHFNYLWDSAQEIKSN
jgi:sugar-specific transcriptional regulator TrmB